MPARRTVFALLAATFLLASAGSVASASVQERIDAAKQEAEDLEAKISARGERIAGLEADAEAAHAQIADLSAQLEGGEARSRELSDQLAEAERSLRESREQLDLARGVLAERLVEIYKHGEPDYASLVLSADGFEEISTQASYLRAFEEADAKAADRVHSLTDDVEERVEEIAGLKTEIDEHNESLVAAREGVAETRASLRDRAAELAGAKAEESRDLAAIRANIEDLQAQLGPKELGALFGDGDWAIPEYIVMCESGGNYHALNPSSGAGGAYQIIPSTWEAYGGTGLPQNAPPAEQDRIAALIWADVGASAWTCA